MKDKEKLSMYVDITRITIILCWIALIAFWCLKLFGGNWFEIMVENENFIKFSQYVQNSWLYYASNLITTFLANFFIFCAISEKFALKKWELIYYLFSSITMWIVANFTTIELLRMNYGYVLIILFAIIVQNKWKKLYGLLAIILELLFTTISLLTRNYNLGLVPDYFTFLVFSIDMYIMYALYYLYVNLLKLKGEKDMAIFVGHGWFSKEDAQQIGYNSWKRFWHNFGYVASFKWARKTK